MPIIDIWVPGKAIPQGSKNIGRNRRTGRPTMYEQQGNDLTIWRTAVWAHARSAMGRRQKVTGPVEVRMEFVLYRPKHLGKTDPAPLSAAAKKPDWDKLARAVGDALTGCVYVDDCQVVDAHVVKRVASFGQSEGVALTVWEA